MTAGNNGASTPEDEDPFGYLYEDGQAQGGSQRRQGGYGYPGPTAQPGVPRTSYNQVRTVGERQYGQQQVPPQQAPYGQQPQYGQPTAPYGQQAPYGQGQAPYGQQPNAHYAAPETHPGGSTTRQVPSSRGGGRGGPNTRGLLIGAIAVVVVVVIGITAAVLSSGGDKENNDAAPTGGASAPASQPADDSKPSDAATDKADEGIQLPKQDAATLKLGPPAALATDIKGAEGTNGSYVTGFNAIGASVTWTADIEKAGSYALSVRYAIPAKDANATLTVNGKANSNPIGLKNFIHSNDPNWEKNWQTTWAPVDLQAGKNTIKISCEQGNQCDAILDWLEVTPPKG
ncbi:CBM35 domain-containing protein [Streptomyces odonnellii]|uniref:CBM35 domain-containing protein n=1 Tax=Streptomyces odonnellii TaxID=1417980 RepID=UPI000626A6AD|nr:CBM35 domain-containing protein [Streptomyces odonnellii]